jgi:glycosyltransferase involved in cell wall biosynthesis
VPCVSTSIAGIPELIRTGVDGLLVPPADPNALADALRQLIEDPALRRTYGASARARIIGHYNLPLNQELLARVFERQLTPIHLPGGHLNRHSARHSNINTYPSNPAAP